MVGRRLYIYGTTAEGFRLGRTAHYQWLASQVINAVSFAAVFVVLFLICIRMLKHKNEFELFVGLITSPNAPLPEIELPETPKYCLVTVHPEVDIADVEIVHICVAFVD